MRYVAPAIVAVAAIMMVLAVLTTQRPTVIMAPISSAVALRPVDAGKSIHGIVRLRVAPTYSLDVAITPSTRAVIVNEPHSQMAVTSGQDVTLAGWAVDGAAMKPARAVLIELDGAYVPAIYGDERPDVAKVLGDADLKQVGFRAILPAAKITSGKHTIGIIVVNAAGTGYYDSPERLTLVAKP